MGILHQRLPEDMVAQARLPGTRPVTGDWLRVDEAYGAQMAERRRLIADGAPVHALLDRARSPARELLEMVLGMVPNLGFEREGNNVLCPDGHRESIDSDDPLRVLGRLVQCDFCLLQPDEAEPAPREHILSGAILCFPASWMLAEKFDRPLTAIHGRVPEYDDALARRVQRLFDGVQVGRPVWRFNQLWYQDPTLFQPRSVNAPRPLEDVSSDWPYYRTERQTVLRLPETKAMVFAIHTYVLARDDVPAELRTTQDKHTA